MSDEKKSKVFSISTLAGEFTTKGEIQQYANNLFLKNKEAVEKIQFLQAEIAHLKMLLSSAVPLIGEDNSKFSPSNEQIVCEIEIKRLKDKSMEAELSFDDTKKLEILVKTLKLITNKSVKDIKADFYKKDEISDEMLSSLASQTVKEE